MTNKEILYEKYITQYDDIGVVLIYNFYPNGIWDEHNHTYDEAILAYPLDKFDWVEMEER